MSQSANPEVTAQKEPQTPDSRATSFQAVQTEPEHYSGEVLLVSAYALVWAFLFAWVAFVWRKQNALDGRLDDIEREIAKADAKQRS
jgi:CcmD family protein